MNSGGVKLYYEGHDIRSVLESDYRFGWSMVKFKDRKGVILKPMQKVAQMIENHLEVY